MYKKPLLVISVLALLLTFSEILLRLQGFQHRQGGISQGVQIMPNHLLAFDSLLGIRTVPGKYDVALLNKRFVITVDSEGHRITGPKSRSTDTGITHIFFLGGPSTFGFGINDSETYPWYVQESLPGYDIKNISMLHFGLAENYVQLTQLTKLNSGDIIVYVYHSSQDSRGAKLFDKHRNLLPDLDSVVPNYHYLLIDSNLKTHLHKYKHYSIPFSNCLALSNYFEETINSVSNNNDAAHEITEKALLAMNNFCERKNCRFILIYRRDNKYNQETIKFCREHGIKAASISADISLRRSGQTSLGDSNKNFAGQLVNYLVTCKFIYSTGTQTNLR
jgi:hypothetical protein